MSNSRSNENLPLSKILKSPSKMAWGTYFFCLIFNWLIPNAGFLSTLIGFLGLTSLVLAIGLSIINYLSKKQKQEASIRNNVLKNLEFLNTQFDENIANQTLDELRGLSSSFDSQNFYNSALELIITHKGDARIKVFALNMGRWYYSLQRPERKPTIYDEQAIQNDINARNS